MGRASRRPIVLSFRTPAADAARLHVCARSPPARVDVIAGYTSDGLIAKYDLVALGDPKHAIPPYDAIVLLVAEAQGRCRAEVGAAAAARQDRHHGDARRPIWARGGNDASPHRPTRRRDGSGNRVQNAPIAAPGPPGRPKLTRASRSNPYRHGVALLRGRVGRAANVPSANASQPKLPDNAHHQNDPAWESGPTCGADRQIPARVDAGVGWIAILP